MTPVPGWEPTLITLVDGRIVMCNAESWRYESMARQVLAKPLPERLDYLADYERRHGAEETQRLKAKLMELRTAQSPAKPDSSPVAARSGPGTCLGTTGPEKSI